MDRFEPFLVSVKTPIQYQRIKIDKTKYCCPLKPVTFQIEYSKIFMFNGQYQKIILALKESIKVIYYFLTEKRFHECCGLIAKKINNVENNS